jgi:hypothetical protein
MRSRSLGALLGLVVVLAIAAGAAWLFREDLMRRFARQPEPVQVSEAAAAMAEAKLERLRDHGEPAQLSGVEISSLIRYRLSGWVPAQLRDPSVALSGDTVRLGGRVPTAELPEVPELDRVRSFLPDTAQVAVTGRLTTLGTGRAAFDVAEVAVSGVPLPARFYPDVLERLGRRNEPGLAPTAVPFALPEGVGSARVENGYLLLAP